MGKLFRLLAIILIVMFFGCTYKSDKVEIEVTQDGVVALAALIEVAGPIISTILLRDVTCEECIFYQFADGTKAVVINDELVRVIEVGKNR